MSKKLSTAELRAMLAGITPGPWESHTLMATGKFGIYGRIDPLGKAYRINDARAIAHVPALLAEVIALREAAGDMRGALRSAVWQMEQCEKMFRDDEAFIGALNDARAALADV